MRYLLYNHKFPIMSAEKSSIASDVNKLLDDILSNPDKPVDKMTKEQIVEMQKKINLYGVVIPSEEAWANISIVNFRENYMRKLCVTSLIAYLFRLSAEYFKTERENTPCPTALYDAFGVNKANLTLEQQQTLDAKYRAIVSSEICSFLQYNFNYDPDRHLKSAYKENMDDPERVGKFEQWRERMRTEAPMPSYTDRASSKLEKLKASGLSEAQLLLLDDYVQDVTNSTDEVIAQCNNTCTLATSLLHKASTSLDAFTKSNPFADLMIARDLYEQLNARTSLTQTEQTMKDLVSSYMLADPNSMLDSVDLQSIFTGLSTKLASLQQDLAPYNKKLVDGAGTWVPPVDVFHHFDRFLTNHYEQLRECVNILYCEKPDIEFAVQFYGKSHSTHQEALQAVASIRDRVTTAVYSISNEGWFLLGPFKQNRERVEFYNKNTEILKRMMEQAESDSRLGADLMKKRVVRKKEQNIIECGPEDPGLVKYQEALGVIERLGSKPLLTKEEKDKMAEAVRTKEMAEVPPDAIQVDVHKPVVDADGNTTLQREKFYTQAEAPKFMEENLKEQNDICEAVGKGVPADQAIKTIRSRTGQITSLAELKNNITPKGS